MEDKIVKLTHVLNDITQTGINLQQQGYTFSKWIQIRHSRFIVLMQRKTINQKYLEINS